MKTQIFTIVFLVGAMLCSAQSIERSVVASAGDYFEGAGVSMSWTLGEIATETYNSGNIILTQGFQQPGITLRIYVDLTAFLEGPFNGSEMNTDLNNLPEFPLTQPFNQPPWNYMGTENVASIPNNEVVDWFLVELRDAIDAPSATLATRIARKAVFILSSGAVVDIDGISNLEFSESIANQLFVVLWHRNHLGMMSAFPLSESGGVYSYNFTTAMGMAYLNGQKSLNGSVYGMYAGNADVNAVVDDNDKILWEGNAGDKGYLPTDFNMNGQASNQDKNEKWLGNKGVTSKVPE